MTDNLAMILKMINNIEQEDVAEKKEEQVSPLLEDALPKVGVPLDFIHVASDAKPSLISASSADTSTANTSSKDTPSIPAAHLLQEYMHYFAPQQHDSAFDTSSTPSHTSRLSVRSLWWLGSIIVCLLLANIITMLTHYSSRSGDNVAVIEFEKTDVPALRTPEDTLSAQDTPPYEYAAPPLHVPKRRVLVISEETRKELLQQLKQAEDSPDALPSEERLEFYQK